MTSFYYNYQNPRVCCFLVEIKAIVLLSSAGLTNLNNKAKPKWILVVVVKYRHRAIVLLVGIHHHIWCAKNCNNSVTLFAVRSIACFYASGSSYLSAKKILWAHCALSVFIDKIRLFKVLAKDEGTFKSVKELTSREIEHAWSLESSKEAYKKKLLEDLASWVLSKLPKCSISRHRHSWSMY